MIKIVPKRAGKNSWCCVKLVSLAVVSSSLFGMNPDGVQAQLAVITVTQNKEDPVSHWIRVGALLTPINRECLDREYSQEQLGGVLSVLQSSPIGTRRRMAYDDLVTGLPDNGQRAQKLTLFILAELCEQNNQRQELAENKRSMNCAPCGWWWFLNWGSRVAGVALLAAFLTRVQCDL